MTISRDAQRRVNVLLVEDSPTQALLIRSILESYPRLNLLAVLEDGERASAYLRRQGEYANVERPDLVLLDLNLPGKDGIEVLQEMKADLQLRNIPVVMLTSSDFPDDVAKCYDAGANSYVTKPVDQEGMERVLRQFGDYWGGANVFPRQD